MEPTVYEIPDFRFVEFKNKLDKLNRKAKKLGSEPVSFTVVGHTTRAHRHPDFDKEIPIKYTQITVTGKGPQLGGWTFVARVEPLADGKTSLIHTVPGVSIKVDDRFRTLGPSVCEHCNVRKARKDTFVVCEDVTGIQKQVGRQCLADFTGINTPAKAALATSWCNLFDESTDTSERGFRDYFGSHVPTEKALALTSAYISMFGWVPRSASSETNRPTSSWVGLHFWSGNRTSYEKEIMSTASLLATAPDHMERAAKVVEWVKNELNPRSDYEQNLKTLVSQELATEKHFGLICSAVAAWQKAMNLKAEYAKRNEEKKASRFVGEVGGKIADVPVKVDFVRSMDSHYGPVTLIKFCDENGNLFSWFASGDKKITAGDKFVLKGSIKSHKEYNGIQETQLTRVKLA
jgi:hypothetical protein